MDEPEIILNGINIGSGLKLANPLKELLNPAKTAMAVYECLSNDDADGAKEIIEIYLDALKETSKSMDDKKGK